MTNPELCIADIELTLKTPKKTIKHIFEKKPILLLNGKIPQGSYYKFMLEKYKSKIKHTKKDVLTITNVYNIAFSSKINYNFHEYYPL